MTEEDVVRKVGELARHYYDEDRYSCTEAMLLGVTEVFVPHRVDRKWIPRIATPFNGGFSELNLTCGVLTGALMAIGLVAGRDEPGDEDAKEEAYTLTQIYHRRYMDAVETASCRDLLDRWSDQGPAKGECKSHTQRMAEMLAQTILDVGFHELEVDEDAA